MATWLFKTEPETWSWQQQKKKGAAGEPWSGVRNHQAKLNMMAMKKGDLGFFYHSGKERQIVGIVEVIREYAPDPSDESGRFGMVDFRAVRAIEPPVALATIKADPRLAKMALVANSRLSVQPVSADEWRIVLSLAKPLRPKA